MKGAVSKRRVPDLSWRQWGLVGFAAFVVVGILFRMAVPVEKTEKPSEPVASAENAERPKEQVASVENSQVSPELDPPTAAMPAKQKQWLTYENTDELRGTKNKFASLSSLNSVEFDFPYCCNSKLKIIVRRTSQYGEDVIFQISDGQFQCGIYECSGMVSFDGKSEKLTLVPSEDGDSKTLFAKYPKPIIKKLNSSEMTLVELPFFREGRRQFKFDTYGLDWN